MNLRIEHDDDATSPDDWDDDGLFIVAYHRQFCVRSKCGSDVSAAIDDHRKTHHVFMLEAYIHSAVVLALQNEGNFPDRQWDVSLVGAVLVSKKEWRTKDMARKAALCKIEEWNQYLC